MSYSRGATPKAGSAHVGGGGSILDTEAFRTFKVAHQHVSLDVDLATHSISGSANIILIPLIPNLDYITLDCANMKVTDVLVEGRRCERYIHDDPIRTYSQKYLRSTHDVLYKHNSIEQSHFLRGKFADLSESPEDRTKSQLIIKIPSSIKITLQDADSLTHYTPITPSIRGTPVHQESIFTPISIKIEYELQNPTTGIRFDTALESQPHLWNVYTTNSELCATASHWMPCVNALDEKSTWEIEISIPQKVKHIGTSKIIGQGSTKDTIPTTAEKPVEKSAPEVETATVEQVHKNNVDVNGEEEDEEDDDEEEEEDDQSNPINRDIRVCCSEFSTIKESAHVTDLTKKTVSFQIFNPVAPHHIGWAVGAFDEWELPRIANKEEVLEEETEDSEILGRASTRLGNDLATPLENMEVADVTPIRVYTLRTPDMDEQTVLNSTIVCQKIIDFYSQEFGSYPFTSYSLVFLPTLGEPTINFASLTLCDTRLLYPPQILDDMFTTTDHLAWTIAYQWAGINITPWVVNDIWCCIGMAGYMVFQLWKKLLGNNEFKYRLKKRCEAISERDWERPPIGSTFTGASRPISQRSNDLKFIELKAPMVLHILDRRMTKTERSFGMSRVLPKIFLQAMSGDLPNNSLTAAHFQHVCERVNKNKLDSFFQQWVYGSGIPIFRVTQKFNKKRMVVEMGIRQCQQQELGKDQAIGPDGFFTSALNHLEHSDTSITPCFTGSMTIRIHEPDGTPYDHIIEIKDVFTKLDIQYNTKVRKSRAKRTSSTKTKNKDQTPEGAADPPEKEYEQIDYSSLPRMGTVLTSPNECKNWNLTDIAMVTEGQEQQIQTEGFEWVRIDADFEWISQTFINQPDYMFISQLQQDGDIEAQLEAIRYFEDTIIHASRNSLLYSSVLTRTAMDSRYFYGIRLEACRTLAKFPIKDDPENQKFVGGYSHLIRVFQELFCYPGSSIPVNNDFSNIQKYILQKDIPKLLSEVQDEKKRSPHVVKNFIIDLLTYNENSGNAFDDIYYVCSLITDMIRCAISDKDDDEYVSKVLEQLERYSNLDKWLPSYRLMISNCILKAKLQLHVHGLYDFSGMESIIQDTVLEEENFSSDCYLLRKREGQQDKVATAFQILLMNGGLKNKASLKYFFEYICFFPDVYIREKLVDTLIETVDHIAMEGLIDDFNDDIEHIVERIKPDFTNGMDIEDDSFILLEDFGEALSIRRKEKMKSNVKGLITRLRQEFEHYAPLKQILWSTLHVPTLSLYQKKRLFDVARVMYTLVDSFEVVLPKPRERKLIAKSVEGHKVVIKRDNALKIHLPSKIKLTSLAPQGNKVKIPLEKTKQKKTGKRRVKHTLNRVGMLPIRFIKIKKTAEKKLELSSTPFSNAISILKANSRSFTVRIKIPPATGQPPPQ